MKRAAFFVEGQTELIFVRRLLEEIAGARNIAFHEERRHAKSYLVLKADHVVAQKYYALIVDCAADNAVASAILDRYAVLSAAGYELILGLRDLYPLSFGELPALRAGLGTILPTGNPQAHITIAVAEVESWFMQENTHFGRIDPACTRAAIQATTGFDIEMDSAEALPHPAVTLDTAYRIGGKRYKKSKKHISRTVRAIDCEHLYLDRRAMLASFNEFAVHIEKFLT